MAMTDAVSLVVAESRLIRRIEDDRGKLRRRRVEPSRFLKIGLRVNFPEMEKGTDANACIFA